MLGNYESTGGFAMQTLPVLSRAFAVWVSAWVLK
jgi:hypothetical protein